MTLKIKFRKSAIKNKEGVLYFQLIHKRKVKQITTRFRLFSFEWDNRLSSVITSNANEERRLYLQNMKERLELDIKTINQLINILEKRSDYSINDFLEYYKDNFSNSFLFSFIDYRIKKLKSDNRLKTAAIYETVARSFSRFRCGEDIQIEKIDSMLMQQYEAFLKCNNLSNNSISCYMRVLRAIYNQSVQKGLISSKSPFKYVYTGIDKTVKRSVNIDIILKLSKLDLFGNSNLQQARDLFMFSFYMRGMSFIDMANLTKSNIKNGYIIYSRSKTKQTLTVKIEKCIEEIIERYQNLAIDNYLLPIYNKSNYNYVSHLRTYNKRLSRLSLMLAIEKPLSSYISRHSWATIALRKGIPIQVISEGMGHENEKTTRIYLASLDQSVLDDANAQIIAL